MTEVVEAHTRGDASEIVVRTGTPLSREDRNTLLIDDLYRIVTALNQGVDAGCSRIIVDVRVPEDLPPRARANAEAFIAAIRGIIQALTLELSPEAPAVNIVISEDDRPSDRDRTKRYLLSDNGGYSCGTTYDLRRADA